MMLAGAFASLNQGVLLIADDSGYTRARLRSLFESSFARVVEAEDGASAVALFAEYKPSIVIMDQVMRGRDGIETARVILSRNRNAKIILVTAINEPDFCDQALATGVLRVVAKSDLDGLVVAVKELLEK